MASPTSTTTSYWCYTCTRTVSVLSGGGNGVVCPHCDGGFIQAVDPTDFSPGPLRRSNSPRAGHGRRRRNGLSFNPLIVRRSPPELERPPDEGGGGGSSYELYYDDGAGSGLRPLPAMMSESLLGSGFELMLDRLSQIGFSLWSRPDNPPASKKAVESLPVVEIKSTHVCSDMHCAVCKEAFVIGSEAREMPCKHIYHSECILPWLSLRNSCPVCRHELPAEDTAAAPGSAVGLTLWRLPGGGFAVGRFIGGEDGNMPAVYSEMDGSLGLNGGSRRVNEVGMGPWLRRRREGRLRRLFGNLRAFFLRVRSGSSSDLDIDSNYSVFRRYLLRRQRRRDSVSLES